MEPFSETFQAQILGAGELQFRMYYSQDVLLLNKEYTITVYIDTQGQVTAGAEPKLYSGYEAEFYPPRVFEEDLGATSGDYEPEYTSDGDVIWPTMATNADSFAPDTVVYGVLRHSEVGSTRFTACSYCSVEIWDQDYTTGNDYLGRTVTKYDGSFQKVIENADGDSGIDPFLVVVAHTELARVMRTDATSYSFRTGVLRTNCPDGSCQISTDYVFDINTESTVKKAFWIYKSMASGWYSVRRTGGEYWTNKGAFPRG